MGLLALPASVALAQDELPASAASSAAALSPVVVTATRSERSPFDLPASVDAVHLQANPDRRLTDTSESLREVPGVLARNRQNAAQDEQISIRGFGARTTFGVRGVRLYLDGIPATMPDGQGQLSHFDPGAADRIEVLRGPFSALYGNASGGVIQLFTAEGTEPPQWNLTLGGGRYAGHHVELGTRGVAAGVDWNVDLSRQDGDGWRRHSRARRDNGNAVLRFDLDDSNHLTVLANSVRIDADDPKGLTWAEYLADPRQAPALALTYDTRKSVRQDQGGLVFEHDDDHGGQWRALAYYGQRTVQQFLSIPPAAQAGPLSAGGVVDLSGNYEGVDLRRSWRGQLGGRPFELVVGASHDRQNQHRRGYENFVGGQLGVVGALRRDEGNLVQDFDQYAQADWRFASRWSLSAGLRHSRVRFAVDDHYIVAGNPDDSGRRSYGATTPVAGLLFRANDHWHLYGSWGQGFETPTFNELGYRTDGRSGLNLDLPATRSDNLELGSKWHWGTSNDATLAWFQADTRHELAVAGNTNGRTTYSDHGSARRQGVEAQLDLALAPQWQAHLAYTWLHARFDQPLAGNQNRRLAGVPSSTFDASLRWGGTRGWHAQAHLAAIGPVTVDDAGSARAPGYALADASVGYVIETAHARIAPFLRLDNLFDRRYIGSVIVNESSGRYFESGPGRALYLGCRIEGW